MNGKKHQLLVDAVQRLLRREAYANIRRIFERTHPADVALIIAEFDLDRWDVLLNLIENIDTRADVLAEIVHPRVAEYLQRKSPAAIAEILAHMESDDAADLVGLLPEELSKEVLARLKGDGQDVHDLMKYREDTAGGIMTPDFIALRENITVQEAIATVRDRKDVEMAFYLYVVNELDQLVGVLSIRKLVLVSPDVILHDIMEPNVISVRTQTDQEEVAKIVARYNFLAVPVVDDEGVLRGIVTVDDVIDVIREEATEDMLKMAGAGQEIFETRSVSKSVRSRFPWLLVACLGELIGIVAIAPFLGQIKTHHYVALFMPIIMAMGGNVGTQSATVIVRGLATGYLDPKKMASTYWRELRIALALGLAYGVLVSAVSYFFSDYSAVYALSIVLSMTTAMAIAVTVGTLLPVIMVKLHVDPAVSTGPFVTSAVDVLGLIAYFAISTSLLSVPI